MRGIFLLRLPPLQGRRPAGRKSRTDDGRRERM